MVVALQRTQRTVQVAIPLLQVLAFTAGRLHRAGALCTRTVPCSRTLVTRCPRTRHNLRTPSTHRHWRSLLGVLPRAEVEECPLDQAMRSKHRR